MSATKDALEAAHQALLELLWATERESDETVARLIDWSTFDEAVDALPAEVVALQDELDVLRDLVTIADMTKRVAGGDSRHYRAGKAAQLLDAATSLRERLGSTEPERDEGEHSSTCNRGAHGADLACAGCRS